MVTVLGLSVLLVGLALLALRRLPPEQALLVDRFGQGTQPPQRGIAIVVPGLDQVRARLRTGPIVHQVTVPASSDPDSSPVLIRVTLRYSIHDPIAVVALGDRLPDVLDAHIETALAEHGATSPNASGYPPLPLHRLTLAAELTTALKTIGLTLVALDQVTGEPLSRQPYRQTANGTQRQPEADAQRPSPRDRILKPTLPAPAGDAPQTPPDTASHPAVTGPS